MSTWARATPGMSTLRRLCKRLPRRNAHNPLTLRRTLRSQHHCSVNASISFGSNEMVPST